MNTFKCKEALESSTLSLTIFFHIPSELENGRIPVLLEGEKENSLDFSLTECVFTSRPGYGGPRYFHCRDIDFLDFDSLRLFHWSSSGGGKLQARFDKNFKLACKLQRRSITK